MMAVSSSLLPGLPADYYGVRVDNEMDSRRLLYLITQVGAEKVAGSASRYSQRYPGERIFVSVLLKHYRIKVPSHVFAPTQVPFYRVYLLLDPASATVKLGYSGDWIARAGQFQRDFDPDRSVGIAFGGNKASALRAERMAKSLFRWAKAEPPRVPYGAGGHLEWYHAVILDAAATAIASFEMPRQRNLWTLREAWQHDLRAGSYLANGPVN